MDWGRGLDIAELVGIVNDSNCNWGLCKAMNMVFCVLGSLDLSNADTIL